MPSYEQIMALLARDSEKTITGKVINVGLGRARSIKRMTGCTFSLKPDTKSWHETTKVRRQYLRHA